MGGEGDIRVVRRFSYFLYINFSRYLTLGLLSANYLLFLLFFLFLSFVSLLHPHCIPCNVPRKDKVFLSLSLSRSLSRLESTIKFDATVGSIERASENQDIADSRQFDRVELTPEKRKKNISPMI